MVEDGSDADCVVVVSFLWTIVMKLRYDLLVAKTCPLKEKLFPPTLHLERNHMLK